MEHWKRLTRAVAQTVPLYVRRLDYHRREFAVRHPEHGMIILGECSREACYDVARMRNLTRRARHILNH